MELFHGAPESMEGREPREIRAYELLERAGVNEADRKRLMGHSLKGDVTNGVYGHRGIEELRECVEMIKVGG